jgi:hypothetical protein
VEEFKSTKENMDSPTPMKIEGTWNDLYPADNGNFYFCDCNKFTIFACSPDWRYRLFVKIAKGLHLACSCAMSSYEHLASTILRDIRDSDKMYYTTLKTPNFVNKLFQ